MSSRPLHFSFHQCCFSSLEKVIQINFFFNFYNFVHSKILFRVFFSMSKGTNIEGK